VLQRLAEPGGHSRVPVHNSSTATKDLPAYNHARHSSGPITLYCKSHGSPPQRWSYPQQFGNPYGQPGHKWSGHDNGDDGHGRLVLIRSMKLINPGTWPIKMLPADASASVQQHLDDVDDVV
jgi:hypothetical protein